VVVAVEAGVVADAEAVGADMQSSFPDRVGLGWRPELAAGIFAHRDQIDVVEVIAEDWFDRPRHKLSALRTLSTQIPVQLHGTSAGMASAEPVEERRLAKMARLVEFVQPESWSEHLAFVRAGGFEIGHLAAVPRNASTVSDAAANIDRAQRIVGTTPMVENIATLIAPPASPLTEAQWLSHVVTAANAPLLLDLHNLYSNSVNFGDDPVTTPLAALRELPLDRVGTVHIAGGRWIQPQRDGTEDKRWLDDHLHPVPDAVFTMLEELAALAPQPLTVILERDGAYPSMEDLLSELRVARRALKSGREQRRPAVVPSLGNSEDDCAGIGSNSLQIMLARLYVDDSLRASFLAGPALFAGRHGLNYQDAAALASIDRRGLPMAARSFAKKRQLKRQMGR
jgi:uncharacterized protein